MKRLTCILLLLALLCGCAPPVRERIADDADKEITVTGLGADFTVTAAAFSELKLITQSASGATAKAGNVSVTGPPLETSLTHYGYRAADANKVRFPCGDGYKVVLRAETLTEYDVILGIAETDGALEKNGARCAC